MTFYTERILPLVRPYGRRLQRQLDQWLVARANEDRPGGLDGPLASTVRRARLALLLALEGTQGRAQVWQGVEKTSGRPLRVAYLGDLQGYKVASPQYLQHTLFQPGSVRVEERGPLAMRSAGRAAQTYPDADLVIIEGNDLLRWQPPGGLWLRAPTWVRMVMDFPPDEPWETVYRKMHAQRKNIRSAERSGFTFAISKAERDFEFFYDRLHVPTMASRHKEYGLVDKKENMRASFEKGVLFQVCQGEQMVAAGLVEIHGRSVYGITNGVLDGDRALYSRGAMSMLYFGSIRWCHEQGMRHYDVGGVRPFASDGLYQHKQHWGMHPMRDLWLGRSWLLWSPTETPTTQDWLAAHPPIPVEGVQVGPALAPAA